METAAWFIGAMLAMNASIALVSLVNAMLRDRKMMRQQQALQQTLEDGQQAARVSMQEARDRERERDEDWRRYAEVTAGVKFDRMTDAEVLELVRGTNDDGEVDAEA